jgi:hypothetical protein
LLFLRFYRKHELACIDGKGRLQKQILTPDALLLSAVLDSALWLLTLSPIGAQTRDLQPPSANLVHGDGRNSGQLFGTV